MPKRGVDSGYHEETHKVGTLVSDVAKFKDKLTRESHLNASQVSRVSTVFNDLVTAMTTYGSRAAKDVKAFDDLGVKIEVEDTKDAQATKARKK
jgi:hypothetical protein